MEKLFFSFILMVLLFSSGVAFGDQPIWEARCGGKIIKPGLSKSYLINNCREPDHTEQYTRGSEGRTAQMEKLYYYTERLTYIVTVRNGIIESITIEPR